MAFIAPFRHWVVYPALLRQIERAWQARGLPGGQGVAEHLALDAVGDGDAVAIGVGQGGAGGQEQLDGSFARTASKMGSTHPACTKGLTIRQRR
jgi:hypothetical protein